MGLAKGKQINIRDDSLEDRNKDRRIRIWEIAYGVKLAPCTLLICI